MPTKIFWLLGIILLASLTGWREWRWRQADAAWQGQMNAYRLDLDMLKSERASVQGQFDDCEESNEHLNERLQAEANRLEHQESLTAMWRERYEERDQAYSERTTAWESLRETLRQERSERIAQTRQWQETLTRETSQLQSRIRLLEETQEQVRRESESHPLRHGRFEILAVAGNRHYLAVSGDSKDPVPAEKTLLLMRDQGLVGMARLKETSGEHLLLRVFPMPGYRDALVKGDFFTMLWPD